jgi:UDP-N-acetylmuramyl pentapeptide synthase
MLKKHKPLVVGVTGSVGKSSAKDAIALALSSHYTVRKTEGNLNNEFGTPLSVFGLRSGGSSTLAWAVVLLRMLQQRYFTHTFPEALVLEMGVDRPGDMKYLLSFVTIDIGVVTHVSASHLKFFKSLGGIAKEKGEIIRSFQSGKGVAIVNADNPYTRAMKEKTNAARVITYGLKQEADVRGNNLTLLQNTQGTKMPSYTLKIEAEGRSVPLRLPKIAAAHHISAVLAAVSVAVAQKLNLVEVVQKLESFTPLPGRLRALPGVKNMILLDDTYNASPTSTKEALKVLGQMETPRRVAILGDMLELGADSDHLHEDLYNDILASGSQVVVLVGSHMKALWQVFQNNKPEGVSSYWEESPVAVAQNIQSVLGEGDSVLVKGSQGMRMEIVSKKLLIDEALAKDVLCRQSKEWLAKPFVVPVE